MLFFFTLPFALIFFRQFSIDIYVSVHSLLGRYFVFPFAWAHISTSLFLCFCFFFVVVLYRFIFRPFLNTIAQASLSLKNEMYKTFFLFKVSWRWPKLGLANRAFRKNSGGKLRPAGSDPRVGDGLVWNPSPMAFKYTFLDRMQRF